MKCIYLFIDIVHPVNRTGSPQGFSLNQILPSEVEYNTNIAHFTNVKHYYKHIPKVSPFGIALIKK